MTGDEYDRVEEALHNALENAENDESSFWIRTALQRLDADGTCSS